MGARVRRELEARQETQEPRVAWAKQVRQVVQERREGLAQLAKEEQMALQGKLEPQAVRELLARQVILELLAPQVQQVLSVPDRQAVQVQEVRMV
jgi:hypothetical protein